MKYNISRISIIVALTLIISSCESHLINGDLDGFWQVQTIEHFESGEVDYNNSDAFYSFQRHMVQLTYHSPSHVVGQLGSRYHANFDLKDDSIGMGDFRTYDLANSEEKTPLEALLRFGIYEEYTMFHMNLSEKELILTSDKACIVLRKY